MTSAQGNLRRPEPGHEPTGQVDRRTGGSASARHARPVLITGMHRSGTSFVAGALSACGLYLGPAEDLIPPAADNPGGFFEHIGLVSISEELLERAGGAWDLPPDGGVAAPGGAPDLAQRATEATGKLGSNAAGAWGWKDPRLCLTAPFWQEVTGPNTVVFCVRHPLEVAVSLHERNGVSYSLALSLWYRYTRALLDATNPDQRVVTHFDALFSGTEAELRRVVAAAGLAASDESIGAAVNTWKRGLRHSRLARSDLVESAVSPAVVDLYDAVCAEAGWRDDGSGRVDSSPVPPGTPAPARRARRPPVPRAPVEPGRVDPHQVAYRQLEYRYHRRGGHIAILERRVEELEGALAAASARSMAAEADDVVVAQLRALRGAVGELGIDLAALRGGEESPEVASRRRRRALETLRELPLGPDAIIGVAGAAPAELGHRAESFPLCAPAAGAPEATLERQLHALRAESGITHLAVVGGRSHLEALERSLADAISTTRRVVLDEPDLLVADLRIRCLAPPLADQVRLVAADFRRRTGRWPSILDWHSGRDVASAAPKETVFSPRWPDQPDLVYADGSVDIVVIGSHDPARAAEAGRVAGDAVVVFECVEGARYPVVHPVVPHRPLAVSFVVTGPAQPGWRAAVSESLSTTTVAEFVFPEPGTEPGATVAAGMRRATHDVVAVLTPWVCPLPGWLDELVGLLHRGDVSAAAPLLLRLDGRVAAAGASFTDGRLAAAHAGTAVGSFGAAHVQPVVACGALVTTAPRLAELHGLDGPHGLEPGWDSGLAAVADLSLRLQGSGSVLLQPESLAVALRDPVADLTAAQLARRPVANRVAARSSAG